MQPLSKFAQHSLSNDELRDIIFFINALIHRRNFTHLQP